MIRKKSEFLEPIPGKTYEVGDVVTVLDKCLPGTCPNDYRFGFYESVRNKYGGKKFRIVGKDPCRYTYDVKVPDDETLYTLSFLGVAATCSFSSGMFLESYRKHGKKEVFGNSTTTNPGEDL